MTYRDDHDAAIARAESLEEQVADLERERDRLRRELEAAKRPAPSAPPAPQVPSPREELGLAVAEVDTLVRMLEEGTESAKRSGLMLLGGLAMAAFGVIALIAGATGMGLMITGGGVVICLLFVNGLFDVPAEALAIIEAVRDQPDRILSVSETSTRDGRQLVLGTATGSLRIQSSDTTTVRALLARRCPNARFMNES